MYIYRNKSFYKLIIVLNVFLLVEEFYKIGVIIRFIVLFFECFFVKLFQVEGIDEMFRVEFFVYGCDISVGDGFLIVGIQGVSFGMVVGFIVG